MESKTLRYIELFGKVCAVVINSRGEVEIQETALESND